MFPSINATVSSLYSLPLRPFTAGFIFFSRYMNSRAKMMTLGETWVVERIETTHFLNPLEGIASFRSRFITVVLDTVSAFFSVSVDSNQNKQVIYMTLGCVDMIMASISHLRSKFGQASAAVVYGRRNLEGLRDYVSTCAGWSLCRSRKSREIRLRSALNRTWYSICWVRGYLRIITHCRCQRRR